MKSIIAARGETVAEQAPSIRWALASLSLSMLLPSLGTSIANVGLPSLAQAFDAPFQDVQWIVLAYLLAITTLIVSVGRLGDITGRRRLLLIGILLFTLASILCGVAPTLWLMIAARAVQGLGAAIMMALTMAFVGETVPKAKTGSAMGLLGTMSAIGTALGPSLGGLLIAGLGWPAIFLVNVPLGILTFVLAYRHLPADISKGKTDRKGFDMAGTLLLALTLSAYALAMTIGHGRFGLLNIALLSFAVLRHRFLRLRRGESDIAADPVDGVPQSRAQRQPGDERTGFDRDDGDASGGAILPFPSARAQSGSRRHRHVDRPRHLHLERGPGRRTVDRLDTSFVVVAGLVAMTAGSIAMALLPGISGYITAIAMLTPGYQLFQAANNTAVMADVRPDQRGVISGMLNLSRNLGLITGASMMGAVFALASGTSDVAVAHPEAVASGMQITFAVAAALIIVALAIALGTYRRRRALGES